MVEHGEQGDIISASCNNVSKGVTEPSIRQARLGSVLKEKLEPIHEYVYKLTSRV